MNRNEQLLSLIGLCLRGRNLEIGEEPVEAVSRARDARLLLLASDAADNTTRRVKRFAEVGQCVWLRVPFTRQELGRATGRSSVAVAAVTDIGLAVAIVRRLAEQDPVQYDADLARLELKAQRAAERKSEAARHEKNLRRGVKRPKKQEADTAAAAREPNRDRKPEGKAPSRKQTSGAPRKASGSKGGWEKSFSGKSGGAPSRRSSSRPSKANRPRSGAKPDPYAHSRPVKKGKGSFRKKEV